MREGRVSYEKARLVAGCADDASVDSWIERARGTTCVDLRREIEATEEEQMCARGVLGLRVPERVRRLLGAALQAARESSERFLSQGECLAMMAGHFIATWKPQLAGRSTVQKRVLARDRGFCQVPGCSRAATHAHHVLFRSRGGGNDDTNLVGVCAGHHLHAIHAGYLRVRGRAPDDLRWELVTPLGLVPFWPGG